MGLRQDIQNDIEEAFDIDLADAVTSFDYREITRTFDPVTNTESEAIVDYTSRGVFTKFKREVYKDSSILPTDTKLIILQHELAVIPVAHNFIVTADRTYTIIKIMQDPAAASWTLQCRE